MAVRKNGYYADPALAASFDNLAEAFKTPSGSDVLGYTKSTAEREKALRLKDLYDYAKSADYNQERADRMGVAVGNYAPTQSYYAVDENNDTSLKTNAATNATTLAVTDKNNAGALARQFAQPILLGDGQTARLPQQTAAAMGLPDMFRGNITANEGQTVTTPTGEVIKGTPKLPTDSQVIGAITAGLPANEQRAVATKGVALAPVLDAKGEPTNVASIDAVGRTPYNVDSRQPQIANYKAPGGAVGTATLDKDSGKWKDTQTGVELPAGSQTYTANLQGDKEQTGLGTGLKNDIDKQLLDLTLTEQTSKSLRNIVKNNPAVQGLAGHIRGTVQDAVQAGGEVGQLFNVNMDRIKKDVAAGRFDPDVVKKFGNFDPNIPATAMLETLLTAQAAQMLFPGDRISNDKYAQVAKSLGAGGMLGNTAKTIATLDQLDREISARRAILAPVRPDAAKIGQTPASAPAPAPAPAPAATPTAAPSSPAPEVWERGPDGQLRRAQ